MRIGTGSGLSLALILAHSLVRGQPLPPQPPPPPTATAPAPSPAPAPPQQPVALPSVQPLRLELRSAEPGVSLSLFTAKANPKTDQPTYVCQSPPCRLYIWPGEYQVNAIESDSTVDGSRSVTLDRNSVVTVDPDTRAHRNAGLGMGIAGPILMVTGFVLLLSSITLDSDQTQAQQERGNAGALMLLGGAVITPIGWVMFGTSFKPEVDVQSARIDHRFYAHKEQTPRGMSFAGALRF